MTGSRTDLDTVATTSLTTSSAPSKLSHQKLLCKVDSTDSALMQPGGDMSDDLRRLSLSSATTNKISFNFNEGSYDIDTAFRILEGNGKGGLTPSSSSNSVKTLSFHSAKELEDYIEGRSSSDSDEAQTTTTTNTTPTSATPARSPQLPVSPRPSLDHVSFKSGTMRSIRNMWKKTGTVSFSKPGEVGGDTILQQGQLEWESSKSSGKWKARLWVLSGSTLGYYRRNGTLMRSSVPQFVPVINILEVLEVFHDNVCFLVDECCFGVDVGSRKHYFKAGSKAEMATWMISLARQKKTVGEYV